ncbi:hypothetical protein Nepgr_024049 [Nepenthes gracilis]|uniref:Uncharacterized protein n=1 Tax=Nepenthes gracilis TaxID=150966 RepID=A0AAD3T5F2_NEPGR|nr:hypothetical protein Nepgr_024049 [Nepenthes gracilis]
MATERQTVTFRDLVEEAKKRVVFLGICIIGLSYLMSLTSSSVWVNLPAAASLTIIFRYLALDLEMRRKAVTYNSRSIAENSDAQKKPFEDPKAVVKKANWRRKVNSPVVEDAIDKFTRHLVSEWITDLWYSRLTPDREGPEELLDIINGVMGEISSRVRNINLIDLLTRDVIHLVCNHLELFRACQAKIEKQKLESLTFDQRDLELRLILAADDKLHPALFSVEAEHKVLQHLMDGVISLTFRPEDLHCTLLRYIARELLACAVMRPVLNLANPRFVNERIEALVISVRNANGGGPTAEDAFQSKQNDPPKISPNHFNRFIDPSVTGVELVQLKTIQSKNSVDKPQGENVSGTNLSKDPLLLVDAHSTRSWNSLPENMQTCDGGNVQRSHSGGDWGNMLDYFSHRKTQALAPENFENMWTKGRNYRNDESQMGEKALQRSSARAPYMVSSSDGLSLHKEKNGVANVNTSKKGMILSGSGVRPRAETTYSFPDRSVSARPLLLLDEDDDEHELLPSDKTESGSSSCYSSEGEDSSITGLDTPTTKVWDGRNNKRSGVAHIRHPLESTSKKMPRRYNRRNYHRMPRMQSDRQVSRLPSQKVPVWQEVERTTLLSGDGLDILNPLKHNAKDDESSDDYDTEIIGRVQSGAGASSSAYSVHQSYISAKSPQTTYFRDTYIKLRCEVFGANIVKSSSKTFAVYSISVTDANNNSWSIKRRFRHFEELHQRLKEYPEYYLHLPPKHFLSTGLDVPVILERCKLLDRYLKELMQLPTVSGSIEVWDFLSVDSQTYMFSSTFSIVDTLPVALDDKPPENSTTGSDYGGIQGTIIDPFKSGREFAESVIKEYTSYMNSNSAADALKLDGKRKSPAASPVKSPAHGYRKTLEDSGSNLDTKVRNHVNSAKDLAHTGKRKEIQDSQQKSERFLDAVSDPTLPMEWVPPNLSAPILDLVDVIFQLQEGAWIRRNAFWVAKQILKLGMGDALDDWLIEKIQLLRKGSVIASLIQRVEQILWPDGIFLTKHPKRRRPSLPGSSSLVSSPSLSSPHYQHPGQIPSPKEQENRKLDDQQQKEVDRRAKFVYEIMIDNAPAAVVGLIGRKEYEQCAKDLYFFLQSVVCMKQLMLELVEIVLLAVFPELNFAIKQLHEEKSKFGEFRPS